MGVAEFERGGVVLAVGGVLFELLLALGVVGGLLLVGGYLLVLLRGGGLIGRDLLPGTRKLLGFVACRLGLSAFLQNSADRRHALYIIKY